METWNSFSTVLGVNVSTPNHHPQHRKSISPDLKLNEDSLMKTFKSLAMARVACSGTARRRQKTVRIEL